jgi:hypothetical protein
MAARVIGRRLAALNFRQGRRKATFVRLKNFAALLGQSLDAAIAEDVRRFQLYLERRERWHVQYDHDGATVLSRVGVPVFAPVASSSKGESENLG